MAPSALLVLIQLQFGPGQSSHHHHHHHPGDDDHYIDQQHNPEHDMNVLLGEEDTGGFKNLSPTEQKMKMEDIVKKIDTDGDGGLSSEEMALWIQKVYRKYAMDDAEERLPLYDTDGDGVVTWEEHNEVAHGQLVHLDLDVVSDDPEQESLKQLYLKERKRFEFADVDQTPGLNVEEFLAFTHPSEVDRMADFTIEDVLSEYDADKDGFISLREFIGDVRGDTDSGPLGWEVEETERFKDLYDQDKDGKLDRAEQLRWVAPNSYGSAREEALHLIREMDGNADGHLSLAEVLKNQDTFVNSEVTDYGRQLRVAHDEL